MNGRRLRLIAAGATAVALAATGCSSTSSNAGNPPYTVAFVIALTGSSSPGNAAAVAAAKARVAEQNAIAGVNGHKVNLLVEDDASTPDGALAAVQRADSHGALAVFAGDSTFEGPAEEYADAHNLPIIGGAADKLTVSDKDLFSVIGSSGPTIPGNNSVGKFFQSVGVSNVAGITWGLCQFCVGLLEGPLNEAKALGVRTAITDLSPTPATADYTPDALKVKQSGADGVFAALGIASDVALARAIRQQNVPVKAQLYLASAYESVALSPTNATALNGTYIEDWFAPAELKSTATERYVATLQKYAPGTFGGLIETTAYVYADLAIAGMKKVHGAMSSAALAQGIRRITNYTGAGLLPAPLNYSLPKTAAANLQTCFWFTRIEDRRFVPLESKPLCGTPS